MHVLFHADMMTTKSSKLEQKIPNRSIRGQISFGNQIKTFPSQSDTRNHQTQNWRTDSKKRFQLTMHLYSLTFCKKFEKCFKCIHFPLFISWPHFSTRCKTCMYLKIPFFFLVCPRYKHIFGTNRATNEQLLFLAPLKTYKKTTTAMNCVERQKTVKTGKKHAKGLYSFQK